jgi:two-component SAPR family response regulator
MSVVLIVEDDKSQARLLEAMISRFLKNSEQGEEILICDTAEKALQICAESYPDVIIADINLGAHQASGIDLKAKIKEKSSPCRDIPFIFISATNDEYKTMFKALAAGGISFLPKPLCMETLKKDINMALQISEVQKEKCILDNEIHNYLTTETEILLKAADIKQVVI